MLYTEYDFEKVPILSSLAMYENYAKLKEWKLKDKGHIKKISENEYINNHVFNKKMKWNTQIKLCPDPYGMAVTVDSCSEVFLKSWHI